MSLTVSEHKNWNEGMLYSQIHVEETLLKLRW